MQWTYVNPWAAGTQQTDVGLRVETTLPYPQDRRETRWMSDDSRDSSTQQMSVYPRAVDIQQTDVNPRVVAKQWTDNSPRAINARQMDHNLMVVAI